MTETERGLLGVLGGMGPAATADFYAKLIRLSPATRDQDHPRIVIWADPTVPPRSAAVLAGTDEPYPLLLAGARVLRDLGVTVAAMPCNTAHAFLPRLVRDTGVPFVDMVAETVQTLLAADGTVALAGTRGTIHSHLYQDKLTDAGIRYVEPADATQQLIDQAIAHVKSGGIAAGTATAVEAIRQLQELGATRVVLACTELPVALDGCAGNDMPQLVDPTEALARAVLDRYWARQPLRSGSSN